MRTLSLAALGLCVAGASCSHEPPTNVLLVVVDGLRADAISSSTGAARVPHLRALARDGASFASCFAHSPALAPATAAILAARSPRESDLRSSGQRIDPTADLLAGHLRERGWSTFACVSAPALRKSGASGLDCGFDSFVEPDSDVVRAGEVAKATTAFFTTADPEEPWFALAQYSDTGGPFEALGTERNEAELLVDGTVLERLVTSEAASFARELVLAPGEHQLVLRSATPFVVRRLLCEIEGEIVEPRVVVGRLGTVVSGFVFSLTNDSGVPTTYRLEAFVHDAPSLAQARARYKREVEAVDRSIGALVAALRERGLYESTCIVITGARGTALGEHGSVGDSGQLFDEILRVPLVVKPPRGFDRGAELARAATDIARHVDLAPTLLDLVDEDVLDGAEGQTLLQRLERSLLAEVHAPDAPDSAFARRDERYKLVYDRARDRFVMFDLRSDALEVENVFELQGHFRAAWQTQLRGLADEAPTTAIARTN